MRVFRLVPRRLYIGFLVLVLCGVFLSLASQAKSSTDWTDNFQKGTLDSKKWQKTESGDFRKNAMDIVKKDSGKNAEYGLRLMADTIGTDDKTVKFIGIRSKDVFDLSDGFEVSVELDWNNQANGSYMSAGFYLSPTATGGNPMDEADWIRVEYVGVPPGENARMTISANEENRVRWLYTEGWPLKNKKGRPITVQNLTLMILDGELVVMENGQEVFRTAPVPIRFEEGFIYLQMSSHSNYPAREIYFDNVKVKRGDSG